MDQNNDKKLIDLSTLIKDERFNRHNVESTSASNAPATHQLPLPNSRRSLRVGIHGSRPQSELVTSLKLNADDVASVLPLTAMQRDMYLNTLLNPTSLQNSLGYAFHIHSALNSDAWREAVQAVSNRYDSLRTTIHAGGFAGADIAYQVIWNHRTIKLDRFDVQNELDSEQAASALAQQFIYRPYDFTKSELTRYALIQLAPEHFVFVMGAHHILMDGVGFATHIQQVVNAYEASQGLAALQGVANNFDQYIDQDRSAFDTDEVFTYWEAKLSGLASLNFDGVLHHDAPTAKVEKSIKIDDVHWAAIKRFCRAQRITPALYFKALYALMIKSYCRPDGDFYIAECHAGRPKGHQNTLGLYFHQVPFVVSNAALSAETSVESFMATLREEQKSLDDKRYISISLQNQLLPESTVSFMYNFIHFYPTIQCLGQEETLEQYMNDVHGQVQFVPKIIDGKCHLNLIYFAKEFNDLNFLDRVLHISHQITDANKQVGDLDFVMPYEWQAQIIGWNATEVAREPVHSVQALFEQQVANTPNAEALVCDGESVTYRALNEKVNRLARYLRAQGVGHDSLVALCMERSEAMVLALLAVLKAGGAYVPIEPELPAARKAFILEDTKAKWVLTQQALMNTLPATGATPFAVDTQWHEVMSFSCENLLARTLPNHLFNVIYTSGSTGNPKGVMVPHQGIINRVQWMQEAYQLSPSDRVLQKTPYGFDVSVWEFIWPLVTGATLVMAKPGGHRDAQYLADIIQSENVTTLHFVPSMLNIFLQEDSVKTCRSIKRVFCSGEALSRDLQDAFFETFDRAELHNLYGPTEASVDVTYWQCHANQAGAVVPIGKPIANTQMFIFDEHMRPVPTGIPGQLFIGGVGLARGYLNLPEKTRESFVPNPHPQVWKGEHLYATGDFARYREDGNIEFLGRIDHQVKMRGFRIELGEIETCLRQHAAVKEAVVMLRGEAESCSLVAYLTCVDGSEISAHALRAHAKQMLPDYMVPAAFLVIDAIPLSSNGKIDRKTLINMDYQTNPHVPEIEPRNPTEQKLAELWKDVLNINEAGPFDDFFELGGHSLLASQLVVRIRDHFDVEMSLPAVFEMPKLADQAMFIATAIRVQQDQQTPDQDDSHGRVELEL